MRNIPEGSLAARILAKQTELKPNFDEEQVKQLLKLQKAKKYLPNPEPNWGPKGRAVGA